MDDARPNPGLYWSIKRSFIRYVARMTDGDILGGHGLHMIDSSTFVFPSHEVPLHFRGDLRLQAHNGALALRIANPLIDLSDERGRILVDHPDGTGQPLPLVTFTVPERDQSPTWTGTDVRLAVDAVSLFGGYYGEGEVFDDFIVVVPTESPS